MVVFSCVLFFVSACVWVCFTLSLCMGVFVVMFSCTRGCIFVLAYACVCVGVDLHVFMHVRIHMCFRVHTCLL